MKTFLILLFAALSGMSCAATGERLLNISELSAAYERTQPVPLTMKNVGSNSIRVYAYLEVLEEGKWVTWPFRLEDGRLSAISNIYLLNPGDSKTLAFDVSRSAHPEIPSGAKPKPVEQLKFRFRVVTLAVTTDEELGEQFSAPFVVRDPFGQAK